jgi:hypothetical protein
VSSRAIPKSQIFGYVSSSSRMFSDFRSRWMMFSRCSAAIPRAIPNTTASRCDGESRGQPWRCRSASKSDPHGTYSVTTAYGYVGEKPMNGRRK